MCTNVLVTDGVGNSEGPTVIVSDDDDDQNRPSPCPLSGTPSKWTPNARYRYVVSYCTLMSHRPCIFLVMLIYLNVVIM